MALVLVVDDEARVRELLGDVIRMDGHEVVTATSADAAMKVMAQRPADVVFTDIQMPGHDGRWLTIQIRKTYPLADAAQAMADFAEQHTVGKLVITM